MSWYQKKHSPTHTHHHHQPSFFSLLHLQRSIASFLFKLHARQSFCTTSLQVLFGLRLGLVCATSYSIHFFTQSLSSFHNTCSYHRSLLCHSTKIMSSNPCLFLNSLLGTLNVTHPSNHSHLCPLKCHLIFVSYRPGLTSMQHTASYTTAEQSPSHTTSI